jgi:hypothetical protein
MTRAKRKLTLAAAAVLSTFAIATPANAAQGMELQLQDDNVFLNGALHPDRAYGLLGQLRTARLRVNVLWAASNGNQARRRSRPRNPRYDFTGLDSVVRNARARGVKLLFTITGPAPAWATGNKKRGVFKPNAKYFRDFASQVAAHFRGLVDMYSIWNEPNLVPWLAPLKSSPRLYRSLYANGYSAIKRVDPGARVLIGETAPYSSRRGRAHPPITFLRGVLRGGGLRADGYAHHPYDLEHKPTFRYPGKANATLRTIGNLTKELDRQARARRLRTPGGAPLDVWITEYGYLRAGRFRVSESRRAAYLRQAYDMALANPRIRSMLQFLLLNPPRQYRFFDMSLVNSRGRGGPAFNALVQWANDHAGQINGNPNSPPPGSQPGGGGTGGGGGGTPGCGLPVCLP